MFERAQKETMELREQLAKAGPIKGSATTAARPAVTFDERSRSVDEENKRLKA